MKNCSKGFSFSETLAAFSIWTIITSLLIPQVIMITIERVNTKQSITAYKLLHEKVQHAAFHKAEMHDEVLTKDNIVYKLKWEEEEAYSKPCVFWENANNKEKKACLLLSK